MTVIQAAILGLVQGLTEFLPVSSSGHLVLLQKVFGITEPALLFDTFLHVGTLAAVLIVLWRELWALLKKPFQKLSWLLIVATLPTVFIALLFKDSIEGFFATGASIGCGFLGTALILTLSEILASRPGERRRQAAMTWLDALIIGLMQALAILPAISRSGSTIAGALSRRIDRETAARFSFLLSIPAILGALVFQLKDLYSNDAVATIGGASPLAIAIGTAVAAAVGVLAVKVMLAIVKGRTLYGFALYTALLGVFVLVDQFWTGFFF